MHFALAELHGEDKPTSHRLVFTMGLNNSSFVRLRLPSLVHLLRRRPRLTPLARSLALQAWHNQVSYFAALPGYAVLVFDNRGVGWSDTPPGAYSTSEMAKDVEELLDFVGWTEPRSLNLAGVSMGGMIAQELVSNRISSPLRVSPALRATQGADLQAKAHARSLARTGPLDPRAHPHPAPDVNHVRLALHAAVLEGSELVPAALLGHSAHPRCADQPRHRHALPRGVPRDGGARRGRVQGQEAKRAGPGGALVLILGDGNDRSPSRELTGLPATVPHRPPSVRTWSARADGRRDVRSSPFRPVPSPCSNAFASDVQEAPRLGGPPRQACFCSPAHCHHSRHGRQPHPCPARTRAAQGHPRACLPCLLPSTPPPR